MRRAAVIEPGVISTLMVATCVLTAYFLVDTKDQTYRTDPVGAASGRDAVPR